MEEINRLRAGTQRGAEEEDGFQRNIERALEEQRKKCGKWLAEVMGGEELKEIQGEEELRKAVEVGL